MAVVLGYILDLLLGDPRWLYHPVRLIGHLIVRTEKAVRKIFPDNEKGLRAGGVVLAFVVIAVSTAVPWLLLYAAGLIHPWLKMILSVWMCYQLLAVKSLKDESMKVHKALKAGDTEGARYAVSMIVGRDTAGLDQEGITKAAMETVAENTSDGIIAPLLYMALGGPVLGFAYKAVNTLDSMVGYKNEKYNHLGRFSAKLDDIVNFIPARLSALLMLAASIFLRYRTADGWRIFKRDRYNHASPNSAQTEAVLAGVLGVQLAGDAWYFGKRHAKPTIGDDYRKVEADDIQKANYLLYMSSLIAVIIIGLVTAVIRVI